MIYGIGVDIVYIKRFERLVTNSKFMDRVFTKNEQAVISCKASKAAGNFSCKEAISKVTKKGISGYGLVDIEILRDENGAPFVNLYGKAREFFSELGIKKIHLSISNTEDIVVAYAVGEMEDV